MSDLRSSYEERHKHVLEPAAKRLEAAIDAYMRGPPAAIPRIDRISARAKSVSRFIEKAEKKNKDGTNKYENPLDQIQDQIGARVIVFYRDDIETVQSRIDRYFRPAEQLPKEPERSEEFGYFGFHYILMVPDDVIPPGTSADHKPQFFELQIRTLFQHAWSEGGHDMAYKPPRPLTSEEKRLLAYSSASAWGADKVMQDLFNQIVLNRAQGGAASAMPAEKKA
jgi:ppGpp synthetase/RelA/SpoT-type nucleotidyltranferase